MLKLLVEFGPIIVFFATYKFSNIFFATMLMLVVTVTGLIVSYLIDKKISMPLLISGVVLLTTGTLTLAIGDSRFIKMKPTIVYLAFCGILFYGVFKKKGFIQFVFGSLIKVKEEAWIELSKRFGMYFLLMAILNEFVWRNYSESFWVSFKVFGFAPITFIFVLCQIPYLYKHQIKDSD
jgi:intracellular septation protein